MENIILYQTVTPQLKTDLSDLIFKFEGMLMVGYSMKDIQKYLTKEELTALVFWYVEKANNSQNTEGVILNKNFFTEFENIQ